MSLSASTTTTVLFQEVITQLYSRRLLFHTPLSLQPAPATPPGGVGNKQAAEPHPGNNRFDANVVMVLSVLLCALICSIGLNSIIRCALRYSRFASSESSDNPSPRIANTGIKKKSLKTFAVVNYSAEIKLPGLDAECVICLSEFSPGEHVKVLPKCNHGFHVRCIDKWLNSHSSCPTCRHCLIETCQKIVGCSMPTTSQPPLPPPLPPAAAVETIVRIMPLAPEGMVHSYQN